MVVLDHHHVLCLAHPQAVVHHVTEPEVLRHPYQARLGPEAVLPSLSDLLVDLVEVTGVVADHLVGD